MEQKNYEARPVRILVESPTLSASVLLGVLNVLRLLEDQGKCNVRFLKTTKIKKEDIIWCDVLVTVRGIEYMSFLIISAAKAGGKFVIYFLDDDLLNIPDNVPSSLYMDEVIKKQIVASIAKSDLLWGVNPLVCEKYSKYCNNKQILSPIPVDISDTKATTRHLKQDIIKILYAGSTDHTGVLQKYISPVVKKLCGEYESKIEFTFIGPDSGIRNNNCVKHVPFISEYDVYRKTVTEGSFQIGLAPIEISDFYKCKYYNKFIEYTSIGAVGVYTSAEPYTFIVKNRENGFLCENTFDGWYSAIKYAIENEEQRLLCFKNALAELKTNFDPNKVALDLEKKIPELVSFYSDESLVKNIKVPNSKYVFYTRRMGELWRKHNILSLLIVFLKVFNKITAKLKYLIRGKL